MLFSTEISWKISENVCLIQKLKFHNSPQQNNLTSFNNSNGINFSSSCLYGCTYLTIPSYEIF